MISYDPNIVRISNLVASHSIWGAENLRCSTVGAGSIMPWSMASACSTGSVNGSSTVDVGTSTGAGGWVIDGGAIAGATSVVEGGAILLSGATPP